MIVYTIVLFLMFFLGLRYWRLLSVSELNPWTFPIAFALKVGMAFCFLFVYTQVLGHGTLSEDAGVFMRESRMLYDVFWESPGTYFKFLTGVGETQPLIATYLPETTHWDVGAQSLINDNKNILRVHSLIHFISFNSEIIHALVCCFVGLMGVKQLYITIKPMVFIRKEVVFWTLLLLPSVFFWSSSILKEPFMLLGLGLFLRGVFHDDSLRKKWLLGIIGGLLLLGFKPYVIFMFIPVLLFLLATRWLPKFKIVGGILILTVLASIAFSLFPGPREKAIHTISRKQFDFVQVGRGGLHVYADSVFYYFRTDQISALHRDHDTVWLKHDIDAQILKLGQISDPVPIHLEADGERWIKYFENTQSNGFIPVTPINNSYRQLVKNIPEALYHALLRPIPGDPGGAMNWIAFIETVLLFSALVWAIAQRKKLNERETIRIAALILFAILLSLIIGWTTPVLGAIARYRIPVYLAILIIAGILYQQKSKTLKHE
ncbi:MAG: hypothetical protein NXI10_15460 [bacterium]|nr:hypothetical protein [bacterium]